MSKESGQKIAIKFTEDLAGDVSENEAAFTVTGKEYQYVNGPLLDKEYQIDAIERYGSSPLWRLGRSLTLANEGIEEDFEDEFIDTKLTVTGTWTRSQRAAQTGLYALESNNKNNSSDTSTYLTFTTNAGKLFSLGYRVSSETNYDKFYLYHNGAVKVNGISGNGSWLTYNGVATEGENIIRARYTKDGSVSSNLNAAFIDNFLLDGEVITPTSHIVGVPKIRSDMRIVWSEDKPAGTGITVEYSTDSEQVLWTEVSNGETITVEADFQIRVTLETSDNQLEPVLTDLWLENIEVSQDTLLLTMNPLSRFNNVEGVLTVAYDATVGTLSGVGGPVASFSEEFAPDGLIKKPNPNDEERIEISEITGAGNLIRIYYTESKTGDDRIEISDISATGVFTHINDL